MPADGEYRVRVTGVLIGKSASPFKINVNRLGLTASPPMSSVSTKLTAITANPTRPRSKRLWPNWKSWKSRSSHSTAFELLGRIYLDVRKDFGKAEVAMEQAIKAKGVALISNFIRQQMAADGEIAVGQLRL